MKIKGNEKSLLDLSGSRNIKNYLECFILVKLCPYTSKSLKMRNFLESSKSFTVRYKILPTSSLHFSQNNLFFIAYFLLSKEKLERMKEEITFMTIINIK